MGAALIGVMLGGCDVVTSPAALQPHPFGAPVDPGPRPDPVTCDRLIRGDVMAAIRIRLDFATPGVATDDAAARAAAADPGTNTVLVGVPLTTAEVRALQQNEFAFDRVSPLNYWVHVGAPERYGGLWIDGGVPTVAVVEGDPGALALARCLEPNGGREVWADISFAAGQALAARIAAETGRWKAKGLQVNEIDYDESAGVVDVGVSVRNARTESMLLESYGQRIRLHQEDPAAPLGSREGPFADVTGRYHGPPAFETAWPSIPTAS